MGVRPEEHTFTLTYEKTRASGKGRFKRGLTDIFVPKLHFPDGYRVKAKGARVVSKPSARHLRLRGRKRADAVRVKISSA